MTWSNLSYSSGEILAATKMNANQANFTALAQQQAGAPALNVSSFMSLVSSLGIAYINSAQIGNLALNTLNVSDFIANIASINNVTAGSGTFNNLTVNFLSTSNIITTSGFASDFGATRFVGSEIDVDKILTNSLNTLTFKASALLATGVSSLAEIRVGSGQVDQLNIKSLTVNSSFRTISGSANLFTVSSKFTEYLQENTKTASYTINSVDINGKITFNNGASSYSLTFPAYGTLPLKTGSMFKIAKQGTGDISVARAAGLAFRGVLGDADFKLDGEDGFAAIATITACNEILWEGAIKA